MKIALVKKCSGYCQKFSLKKLERSIAAAIRHAGGGNGYLAKRLSHEALEYLEGRGKETVESDEVRQAILHIMKQDKHSELANAYELTSLHLKDSKIRDVLKRNGSKQSFHPHKLFKSLKKSFTDAGVEGIKESENLTKEIIAALQDKYANKTAPVEEIRKLALQTLKIRGFKKVERSYLLHKYL